MNISVIIPTYNRAHTIQRAIESVYKQELAVHELIVVDDGSTDKTLEIVHQWPQIKLIQQTHQGVSAARNTGINAAKGEWIALLDSDDEWLPNKLCLQVEQISKNPGFSICHGNELWIRNGEPLKQQKKHRKYGGHIFDKCLPLCVISPSAVLIRRSLLQRVGLFDTALPACEDYDLWLRICANEPVLYVEQPVLRKYGGHNDQLSRKYWGMDRFRITALQKILLGDTLSENQRALTIDMLRHKSQLFAKGARKHGRPEEAENYEKIARAFSH